MSGAELPVLLDVTGRTVLVVGGGPVGQRKAAAVRAAGAVVRLVAPEPPHPTFAADPAVEWIAEPYDRRHLDGVRLAFAAATPAVNERVVADATAAGVWVSSATSPEAGNFTIPAIVRRGRLVLAVGTGGASPAFARRMRDRLAVSFDTVAGDFVALLAAVRPAVLDSVSDPAARRALLDRLSDWTWLERLQKDGVDSTQTAMMAEIRRATGGI